MAWSTIRFAICGPIKPINEIEPATATAADDSVTAIKNKINLSLLNFTPSPRAMLSPV